MNRCDCFTSLIRLPLRAFLPLLALIASIACPTFASGLQINEVVSLNQSGLRDEHNGRPDWIELHNPGPDSVSLAGWSLSDDAGEPRKWTFAAGAIPPGGFLTVFASGKDLQTVPAPSLRPDQIPGLTLWLRAEDLQSFNTVNLRRTAAGDFVRHWPDFSGRNRHARQDQPDLQPRYVSSPSPALRFDGSNDRLQLTTAPATNNFTLIAVFRPTRSHEIDAPGHTGTGGTSGQAWLFGAAHGGDRGAGIGISAGTNGVSLYEHGSSYMPARVLHERDLTGPWSLAIATYADRHPHLAVNGVPGSATSVSDRNPITAPTEIGAGSYGAFSGDVGEIVLYNRPLTDDERRSIEAHLAARHGFHLATSYHTNFRIDAGGERLVLTRPDGSRADDLRIPALPRDIAWGRLNGAPQSLRFFDTPTPSAPNPNDGAVAFLSPPGVSAPAGFHPGAIAVALITPDANAEIRYTLDGSEPVSTSALYSQPLVITNRASLPNRLSIIPTAPGWVTPASRVFKGTVLRARSFRSDALPSDVTTASYFVHPDARRRYTLPVVSLVTDSRHFFDPNTGIYVPGNAPGGNYAQSGDAWERPVHVEFFETDGSRPIAQESGVRMHGNTSFGFPLKALRLHPLNQRGSGPFRHRIFPDLPIHSFNRLLLRPSGHDHALTMMRDGLMQGLVRETGLDMQGYRPAIVFLNGEYWGIHNLQEAFEKDYFESHHPNVDADAIDYLEGYAPGAFPYEGDANHYHDLVRYLQTNSASNPAPYAWIQTRMEIPNYRDYKLAEIFYYRWDIGNHRLWRPRTPDGRLRWILFDCDVGFGGFWSEPAPWTFNMLRAVLEPTGTLHGHNNATTTFLLRALLQNPEFRGDFINRAADLMNSTLGSNRMLEFIDRMAAEIAPEIPEHILRWRAPSTVAEWDRNVAALRTFARERSRHVQQHFLTQFGLPGTAELTLGEPPSGSGCIRLNSLRPFPQATWKGLYFRGNPITLEALPNPGFRFTGWLQFPGLTNNPLTLTLTADSTVTPLFSPTPPLRFERPQRQADGSIALVITGPPDASLHLESSANLSLWAPVSTLQTDPSGRAYPTLPPGPTDARFFRLRQP